MIQAKALEILKSGRNVFLTGEPGAGKTYTINMFTDWMDENGVQYAVTASTGIAASHINGSTIHSWSGIGIMKNLEDVDVDAIRFFKPHYQRIIAAEVLILDEVSMLDAVFLDDLDKVLRAIHKTGAAFGGIQVVMVGDFFQLPPVSQGQVRFAFESDAWNRADFQICYLTEQHRQADPVFTDILKAMRFGKMVSRHHQILGECKKRPESETKLFTHNQDVDRINEAKLKDLPGKEYTFRMYGDGNPKLVAALKRNCLSPEVLRLKKDAVVMFPSNHPKAGYMNGSVGKIVGFMNGLPQVQLFNGPCVEPVKNEWKFLGPNKSVLATIKQYPLRLAWAITVHKSQGMSLDTASIDLSRAFEYGHGYVAISRVRSLEGLHLVGISEDAYKVNPLVLEKDLEFREKGQ